MAERWWVRRIFWIDGLGALAAGTCLLVFRRFFEGLYGLPLNLVTILGLVNLAYAALALTVAVRRPRRIAWIAGLSIANYFWSLVCAFMLIRFYADATSFGLGHFLLEGTWVAALGTVEWRRRRELAATR
jgi:hypothetical protein